MELAATAFSALAPAAGAGGWVTTMATGAGASAGLLQSLSGVATVGSMVTSALSGGLGLLQGMRSAESFDLAARSEMLKSEAQALEIQRDLVKKIGANRVAAAAGGLDISSGDAIEAGLRSQAGFQTTMARTGGEIAAANQRGRGESARLGGYGSLVTAAGNMGRSYLDYEIGVQRRGLDISNRGGS